MFSRTKIAWLLLALGVLTTSVMVLEMRRRQILVELAGLRERKESLLRQYADSERARLELSIGDETNVRQSTQAMLEQARSEVAQLERHATTRRAEMLAQSTRRNASDAAALTGENRDPTKGLARLEYFQNVGTDTPDSSLQTLVWAALKGDDATLAQGLALDGRARERAEILLARLPGEAREKSAPEKLAALWFASTVLDVPAIHISGQVVEDATHVTLLVRGGIGSGQKLAMRLGPTGWQIVVPERALEGIQQEVMGASPPLPRP